MSVATQQLMRHIVTLFIGLSMFFAHSATALVLVGSEYATFLHPFGDKGRYTEVIETVFSNTPYSADVQILRDAFVGSALRTGKADGHAAFIALQPKDPDFVYSNAYAAVELFLASRSESTTEINSFAFVQGARIGAETRFINTQQMRLIDQVRWTRNPTSFDVFRQVADERSDFILLDSHLLDEFDRLLKQARRPVLYRSAAPLITTSVHVSVRRDVADAIQIIDAFNASLKALQENGRLEQILSPNAGKIEGVISRLDPAKYRSMMKNW